MFFAKFYKQKIYPKGKMKKAPSLQSHIDSFMNYISTLWGNEKPLCKLFSTSRNGYLYDSGTNKIVQCEKEEFELLNNLLKLDISTAVDVFCLNHSRQDIQKSIHPLKIPLEKKTF